MRRGAGAALAVVVLVVVLAAVDLLRIRADLQAGQSALTDIDFATIDQRGGLDAVVGRAAERLERAERRARTSPWLAAFSPLPVAGTQVRAVRDLTGVAAQLGTLADTAAGRVQAALDRTAGDPTQRVALVDTVIDELGTVQHGLAGVEPGAGGWLVPPLRSARDSLVAHLASADTQLEDGIRLSRALRGFVAGPRDYLILAANNAEMRAGSGMALSAGVAHVEGGRIEPGDFIPTGELYLGSAGQVPIPPKMAQLYEVDGMGREWRNTNTSPNFPVTAPIFAAMSAKTSLGPVDGVFLVDPVALQVLLRAIGPVTLDGVEYTAANVEQEVLNTNYLRFADRSDRTEVQSRLAVKILQLMETRSYSLTGIAAGLADAATGRHLLAWSRAPAENELWQRVGATGALAPNGLMIAVQNQSASKLDWYIRPRASMTVFDQPDGTHLVKLTVTVPNDIRTGTNANIEEGSVTLTRGQYRTLLTFYLPSDATNVAGVTGGFSRAGEDGPMKVVAELVLLQPGETKTVEMRFTLPAEHRSMLLLPSARIHPLPVLFDGRVYTDARPTVLAW